MKKYLKGEKKQREDQDVLEAKIEAMTEGHKSEQVFTGKHLNIKKHNDKGQDEFEKRTNQVIEDTMKQNEVN